jgi:probable addiction module antidote protein
MSDSPEMFLTALRNVAEARTMAKVAEEAGVNRESLYRALSDEGNPTLGTLNSVLSAVGLRILVGPEEAVAATPSGAVERSAELTFNTGQTLGSASTCTAPSIVVSYINTTTKNHPIVETGDIPWYLIAENKTTELISAGSG